MKQQEILAALAGGKCALSFTTTDNRTISTNGTIKLELIGEDAQKTFQTNQGQNPSQPNSVVFYDLNENRIRSFLIANLRGLPIAV